MKKIKVINSILILFLVLAFSLSLLNVKAATGIGTVKQTYSRTIMENVTYTYTQSDNGNPQRNYVIEYDPVNSGVEALAVFGEYEFGGDTISTNIALAESRGYTVIAGVNASPFDTSNGVTVGTIIQNGIVISANSGESTYDSFAIYNDGHMFIGKSNLSFSYKINDGEAISFQHINKQRKTANNDIYLITSDFAEDTKILADSCEVVLNVTNGALKIGTEVTATVESINNGTTSSRTKTAKGKMILVAKNIEKLGNLKAGDTVKINVTNNDLEHSWENVAQSICGFYEILKDSNVVNNGDPSVHPRTTIGYKADGTIVLWVVDGRQPLLSVGLTDQACAEYMKSLGCVAAIRMDGGGSSNMTIRLPGDTKHTTVNVPSDGEERHDSDALLLVLKNDYDKTDKGDYLLHAYPNTLTVLENTVVDIAVKATDSRYNPKAVPEYTMTVEGDCGSIVDGKFQAKTGTGTGKVKIVGGNTETYVDVKVTNKVTEIYASVNNIACGVNETKTLTVKAYDGSDLLECSNESFTWTCDTEIGTVDEHGVFKATKNSGKTGYITISHGAASFKILVTIGALPKEITGFENDTCGTVNSKSWRNTQANGGTGNCSINTDLQYVKFGEKSLRIDFNLKGTTGTVGTQIGQGSNTQIPGTPTAIGMWVYATESAQGAWIRLQYNESGSTAAKYADFAVEGQTGELHVNWVGWKYLEAQLDTTIKYPISVKYLVRVMGVSETERINGTIYVDSLRAVYGFKNDDFDNPTIENITPESETYLTTQTISFDIKDTGTGINKDATKFYYDGTLISNTQITEIQDGYHVMWTPSALIPLPVGEHTFKVRFEDNFGNFVIKEWKVNVLSKTPVLVASVTEEEVKNRTNFEYTLYTKIDNLNSATFDINYDKEALKVVAVEGATYELQEGVIKCTFTNPQKEDVKKQLVSVTFKALKQGDTTITANNAKYDNVNTMAELAIKKTIVEGRSDAEFVQMVKAININDVYKYREQIVKAGIELQLLDEEIVDSEALNNYKNIVTAYENFIKVLNDNISIAKALADKLGGK